MDKNSEKFSCLVILYHPDENIKNQLLLYTKKFTKLYLYDNSEEKAQWIHEIIEKDNVEYFFDGVNDGISRALNKIISHAVDENFEWLVTMDQDSIFSENTIEIMMRKAEEIQDGTVAIAAANFNKIYWKNNKPVYSKPAYSIKCNTKVLFHITSGNFLYLPIVKEMIPLDDYFIAFVDFDLHYTIHLRGYKVVVIGECVISQQIGERIKSGRIARLGFTNMAPIRYYYLIRNNLYFQNKFKKYKNAVSFARSRRVCYTIKILVCEKQKIKKIKMMYKGYQDYKKKNMGRYMELEK